MATSISQFFVMSPRGDKVIAKDFRYDIISGSEEIFFRKCRLEFLGDPPPCFNSNGINFIHIRKNQLFFVVTTRRNGSISLICECLYRISNLFKDYTGDLTEDSLRKNFLLVYEILDEVFDFGQIQNTSSKDLKYYTFNEPIEIEKESISLIRNTLNNLKITTDKTVIESDAAKKPVQTTKYKKNEIFVDVLERINLIFDDEGNTLYCEIVGSIIMRSFLTGKPIIRMGLNEDLIIGKKNKSYEISIDSINFNSIVDTHAFEKMKILSFLPPDGEFTVLNYRVVSNYNKPFKVFPFIEKQGKYKAELIVKVRAELSKDKYGSNILIKIPLMQTTNSILVEFGEESSDNFYEWKASEKTILWGIKRLDGQTEKTIRIRFASDFEIPDENAKKLMGPISLKFELPMHNMSGLCIRFLKFEERNENYSPKRWIRYITQGTNYIQRL
eukprot:gene1956-1464_t